LKTIKITFLTFILLNMIIMMGFSNVLASAYWPVDEYEYLTYNYSLNYEIDDKYSNIDSKHALAAKYTIIIDEIGNNTLNYSVGISDLKYEFETNRETSEIYFIDQKNYLENDYNNDYQNLLTDKNISISFVGTSDLNVIYSLTAFEDNLEEMEEEYNLMKVDIENDSRTEFEAKGFQNIELSFTGKESDYGYWYETEISYIMTNLDIYSHTEHYEVEFSREGILININLELENIKTAQNGTIMTHVYLNYDLNQQLGFWDTIGEFLFDSWWMLLILLSICILISLRMKTSKKQRLLSEEDDTEEKKRKKIPKKDKYENDDIEKQFDSYI